MYGVEYGAATYIPRVYDHMDVYGVAVFIVGMGMVEWEGVMWLVVLYMTDTKSTELL